MGDAPATTTNMVAGYLNIDDKTVQVNKAQRNAPEESAERLAVLSYLFEGWAPADLTSAVRFRGQASSMQMSGPAAYVAGLLGKEDLWRQGLAQVWNAMPPTERLRLPGIASRDNHTVQEGARALHDLLSLSCALWAGWSIPTLWTRSWPVNV